MKVSIVHNLHQTQQVEKKVLNQDKQVQWVKKLLPRVGWVTES